MKLKSLFIILILLCSMVFSAVTAEEAWQSAGIYVQYIKGETMTIEPNALTQYAGQEYWVYEVVNLGSIQFMIPVSSETGNVEYGSTAKDLMKIHYLANYFYNDDSFSEFLSDLSSFGTSQQADLKSKESNVKKYIDPYVNITFDSKEEYKAALAIAITDTGELISAVSNLQNKMSVINTYDDVSAIELGFDDVFTKEQGLLDSLEEVVNKSDNFQIEASEKFQAGEIDQSTRDAILTYSSHTGLITQVDGKRVDMDLNKGTIDTFFSGMDSKIDQFYITLTKRIDSTEDDDVIIGIGETLSAYSDNYSFFVSELDEKEIPNSYNDVKDEMDDLKELIDDSIKFCEDKDLEECKKAMSNYPDMDRLVASINSSINSYSSGCTSGQTKSCISGGESGTQTCNNGNWGSCLVSPSSGYNLTLIAGLIIIILALIAFKFKEDIMEKIGGGSEPEEEDTGGWQSQWNQ